MWIIKINFVSRHYNEESYLTFRTEANIFDEAVRNGLKKVEQLNQEDKDYIHHLGDVIEFASLEWI